MTIAIVLLYRLGCYVPLPMVPLHELNLEVSGATQLMQMFSGGALSHVGLLSLGIMPYISTQIVLQMLEAVFPSLQDRWGKDQAGADARTRLCRVVSVGVAAVTAFGYVMMYQRLGFDLTSTTYPMWLVVLTIAFALTVGEVIIMWLTELIDQFGIGNGTSIIIFANVISSIGAALVGSWTPNAAAIAQNVAVIVGIVAITFAIAYVESASRRLPVTYGRSRGPMLGGAHTTYLPIKVNTAGMVPVIFASTILYIPYYIAQLVPNADGLRVAATFVTTGWPYWVLEVILIVVTSYFYSQTVLDPEKTADQLRKSGGFINGIRPGRPTEDYIRSIIKHMSLVGALWMALLAVIPQVAHFVTGNQILSVVGGTSMLIVVGTLVDLTQRIDNERKQSNYDTLFR